MSFSYDLTTDVGQVRLLISDTVHTVDGDEAYLFEDAEIQAIIDRTESLDLAAAQLFEILAGSKAKLSIVVRRGDVSEDMTQVAAQLRAQAEQFRAEERATMALGRVVSPTYRTRCS